jgi:hypothetical protein
MKIGSILTLDLEARIKEQTGCKGMHLSKVRNDAVSTHDN